MNSIDDFVTLIRTELGLPVTLDDVKRDLDQVPDWDSVHLLALLTLMERETGRSLSLADALEAPNLARIYAVAVGS